MKRIIQLVLVLVSVFIVESSFAYVYQLLGFEGLRFGKTLQDFESNGIKFRKYGLNHTSVHGDVYVRVNEVVKSIGGVNVYRIEYRFKDNRLVTVGVTFVDDRAGKKFRQLKEEMFSIYGKKREEAVALYPYLIAYNYEWKLFGGIVKLTRSERQGEITLYYFSEQ